MSSKLGQFGAHLREIRIHLSQSSLKSKGTRDFLLRAYPGLKKQNPSLPILIREAEDVQAKAFARFAYGVERSISLEGLNDVDVETKLAALTANK
ncbi:NADH dehydrogenase alpha subcomplex subunit 2 [Globomyces pollinis-pini]|nr:NADH dehydrogenase alpha subcomplex subunit 2 [Globomyces pollinis-pini]